MKFLVLQHINIEHPGIFLKFMREDNIQIDTIELDENEKIPSVSKYDAMIFMGGTMDTWQEKIYPWLKIEKENIHNFVSVKKKPYLGFCLGCQLLGEVIGGKVVKSNPPEIGILDIQMSSDYSKDHVFGDFNSSIKALQWHSYEVQDLESNHDVSLLGSSSTTKYQIFKYKEHAYGIQFHIEIKDNTVSQWACVPEYETALEDSLGKGALEKFDQVAQANMSNMNFNAENLYNNFKKIL